jgi:hypothetical protein
MLEPSSRSLRCLSEYATLEMFEGARSRSAVSEALWDKVRRSASVWGCATAAMLEITGAGAIMPVLGTRGPCWFLEYVVCIFQDRLAVLRRPATWGRTDNP